MKSLDSLLSPIRIKSMEIPNRVVMPPMGTRLGNDDGTVSDANLAYMKRRARGGAGLIITEITEVHPLGITSPKCLCVWDDRFIPGLLKLAEVVHSEGGKNRFAAPSLRKGERLPIQQGCGGRPVGHSQLQIRSVRDSP